MKNYRILRNFLVFFAVSILVSRVYSESLINEDRNFVADEYSLINKDLSLIDESKTLIDKSKTLIDESKTLVDNSKTLIDKSKTLIDNSKTLVDKSSDNINSSNSIGVYSSVVQNIYEETVQSVTENIYQDVYIDPYINGYGKYLKTVATIDPQAKHKFVQFFSDWQWSGQKEDFYTYSASRAEQEKQVALCYDTAIKKFGVGTAIVATTCVVAFFVPGGQIFHLSFILIAKTTTIGAFSGAASGGVISAAIALVQDKSSEELLYETVRGAADGYLIGAITGVAHGSVKAWNAAKNATKIGETCLVFDKKVYDSTSKVIANFSKYDDKTVKAISTLVYGYSDDVAKSVFIKLSECSDDVIKNLISASEIYGDDVGKALVLVIEKNPKDFAKSLEILKTVTREHFSNGIKRGLSLDEIASWDNLKKLLKKAKIDENAYQELGKTVGNGSVLKRNYCSLLHLDEAWIPNYANAHHIIPQHGGGSNGDKLRAILAKFSIDINDGHNCAILPNDPNIADVFGTMCHNGYTGSLHGDKIMTELYSELSRAKSREQAFEILEDFGNAMMTNTPFWL